MKIFRGLVLLLAMAIVPRLALAQVQPEPAKVTAPPLKKTILDNEKATWETLKQKNYSAYGELLADNYVGIDNSGISGFVQYGVHDSDTLPFDQYFGTGLTEFGLVPNRPKDSGGIGLAWSSLNQKTFKRDSEFMFQAYYQAHVTHATFFEPAISYIPNPGADPSLDAALALTFRVISLF